MEHELQQVGHQRYDMTQVYKCPGEQEVLGEESVTPTLEDR